MFKAFMAALTIVLVISVIGYVVLIKQSKDKNAGAPQNGGTQMESVESLWIPDNGWEGVRVPEFTMLGPDGQTRDQSVLEGHVTILTFFFTHCTSVCPAMHGVMYDIEEQLKGTPIRFVSISVDPEHDTPARVSEYAKQWGVDADRWIYLIPDAETLDRIVRRELQFDLSTNSEVLATSDGGEMQNIVHPSHLFLIGPDRQVLGTYEYRFEARVNAITDRARSLAIDLSRR